MQLKASKTRVLLHSLAAEAAWRALVANPAFPLRDARVWSWALCVYLGYHIASDGADISADAVVRRVAAKVQEVKEAPSATGLRIARYSMFCLSSARYRQLLAAECG